MNEPMSRAVTAAGGPTRMAEALGCSPQAVIFYRDGRREVPERYGALIEQASRGEVRRWDLWPETWYRIWPELVGAQGAPAVPQSQEHRNAA